LVSCAKPDADTGRSRVGNPGPNGAFIIHNM
jgi:hypothetical protein